MNLNYLPEVAAVLAEMALVEWQKAAVDGSAGAATAETVMGTLGPGATPVLLGSVRFTPAATLTADPTNNATITINKRTAAAPGTPVAIAVGVTAATGANATGNWTAWSAVALTPAAGAFISPGDAITVAITKGGSGVAVPAGNVALFPATS